MQIINYFSEEERFFIVNGVQTVGGNHTSTKLFTDGVGWQTVHVNFNISSNFFIWQKLTGDNLAGATQKRSLGNKPKKDLYDLFLSGFYTWTAHWAAITPSTGDSANGSKVLSGRRMKSGLRR